MTRLYKLLLIACVLVFVAGCGPTSTASPETDEADTQETVSEEASELAVEEEVEEAAQAAPGSTVVVGVDGDFMSMDPSQSTNATDRHVFFNVYDGLLRLGSQGELLPGLAIDWEANEDGSEYIFYLREGVSFHDGEEFNADVAKWNLERSARETASQASALEMVDSIEVIDDYTIKVILTDPSPFLWRMAERPGLMVSPNSVDESGELLDEVPVGTGPFIFVEWMRDDHLTLVKNESYWDEGKPYIETVIFRPILDSNVRVLELKSGNVQLIEKVPPQEMEALTTTDGVEAIQEAGLGYAYVWLNGTVEPFDKLEVRQALAYAIDRELIADLATFGTGLPGISPIPPSSWAFNPDYSGFEYDPEKAKDLLVEAGYPDGFSFQFIIPPWEEFITSAQVMQEQWAAIGVEAELVQTELNSLLDLMYNMDYTALYIDYSGRIDPDPNLYMHTGCEGGENWSGICNEEAEALTVAARSTIDEATRQELYSEAVPLVVEEQVSQLYICYFGNLIGYSSNLDFVYYPDARFRMYDIQWNE